MTKGSFAQITKGSFLVATPEIDSGIFFRSVIILCEHSLSGSFGLILNKKIDVELTQDLITIDDLTNRDIDMRAGGPLQMNQMMMIHNGEYDPSIELIDGVHLGGDIQFLQEALSQREGPSVRLFFGYASWPSGLLEREFLNGQWFICQGASEHVFETSTENMWGTVLREMGGKYAALSMIPEDLSLN